MFAHHGIYFEEVIWMASPGRELLGRRYVNEVTNLYNCAHVHSGCYMVQTISHFLRHSAQYYTHMQTYIALLTPNYYRHISSSFSMHDLFVFVCILCVFLFHTT